MADDTERVLRRASELALEFVAGLDERHVGALTDDNGLVARLAGPLPDEGEDPETVVEQMARDFDPGLVATAGPRYFGFVVGGQLPAAAGADWLTGTWAQNSNLHPMSPAAAAAELVAGPWMLDLLGLPADASFGFPTGAALGSTVGLAAGRHAVLRRAGWDVEARGLYGAPEIQVFVGDEVHSTVLERSSTWGWVASGSRGSPPTSRAGCGRSSCLPRLTATSRPSWRSRPAT